MCNPRQPKETTHDSRDLRRDGEKVPLLQDCGPGVEGVLSLYISLFRKKQKKGLLLAFRVHKIINLIDTLHSNLYDTTSRSIDYSNDNRGQRPTLALVRTGPLTSRLLQALSAQGSAVVRRKTHLRSPPPYRRLQPTTLSQCG